MAWIHSGHVASPSCAAVHCHPLLVLCTTHRGCSACLMLLWSLHILLDHYLQFHNRFIGKCCFYIIIPIFWPLITQFTVSYGSLLSFLVILCIIDLINFIFKSHCGPWIFGSLIFLCLFIPLTVLAFCLLPSSFTLLCNSFKCLSFFS